MTVATGILNVWQHDPAAVAAAHAEPTRAFPGRFLLGLGIGHPEATAEYTSPLGDDARVPRRPRRRAEPVPSDERVAAALGPEDARARAPSAARRAHLLRHAAAHARAREALGPDALLAPEVAVVVEADAETAREDRARVRPDVPRPVELHRQPAALRLHRRRHRRRRQRPPDRRGDPARDGRGGRRGRCARTSTPAPTTSRSRRSATARRRSPTSRRSRRRSVGRASGADEDDARVEQPVGVERALDRRHRRDLASACGRGRASAPSARPTPCSALIVPPHAATSRRTASSTASSSGRGPSTLTWTLPSPRWPKRIVRAPGATPATTRGTRRRNSPSRASGTPTSILCGTPAAAIASVCASRSRHSRSREAVSSATSASSIPARSSASASASVGSRSAAHSTST